MKRLLVYLSTFLFVFGVSVAFAGVYIENFEDVYIDPWEVDSDFEIEDGKFHMLTGTIDPEGDYVHGTVWAHYPNEFVYNFEGETQMLTDQFNLHPLIDYNTPDLMRIELCFYGEFMEIWVVLEQTDGSYVAEYLEKLTSGILYSWSITTHENHVTIGINNNTYEVFQGVFQKPPSVSESWATIHGITDPGNDVQYYADNLVVYTSTDPTKDTILAFFDDSVESGRIEGSGNNPRLASRRLSSFRQMLERATSFIENDMVDAAYRTLNRALLFCDGEPQPPDYIEGDGVPQLRRMIEYLMGYLTDDDGDGLSEHQGDCNDTDNTIFPGAPEVCDSQDNQCPGDSGYGTVDEGCLTDVQVGGHSYYECRNQNYWIHFQAIDPEHIADSVTVTGPGIDGSLSLAYVDYAPGTWGTYSWFSLGNNLPAPPPLTYTFHIESNGTIYPMDFILQGFNEECVTNLSPTGSVSGDITFSWTGISSPDARYLVELNEYGTGVGIWQSASTENTSIVYNGLPLPTGSHYSFVVYAQDSYGNYSTEMADFVYEPSPP